MTEGSGEAGHRVSRSRWLPEAAWAGLAALLAFLVGAASLRLWAWVPGTPFGLTGDLTQISMQLKDIYDHGWYWSNPDIGFPLGQNGSFFPELNVIHVAAIRVLDLFFSSPYTGGVVFFVASFPLTGAAGYLLARSQGLSRWAGVVVGVLLANAPGHAERYGHLYLAAYWVVPVALWLVLEVARGRSLLSRGPDGRARWRGGRTVLTAVAVLVVGLSGVYYVGFTLILLVVATVLRRANGTAKDWLPGIGLTLAIGVVVALPLAASRVGTAGTLVTGRVPAQRSFVESELFAGKLMDLLLPWPGHRSDLAAYVTNGYRATTDATVEVSALGIVGVVGFVALVVLGLVTVFGGRPLDRDLGRWSALSFVSFALYTVGGLGAFIALFFTGQVRTWSRMSLYLLVFALLAVGYWLTRLERRRGTVVAGGVAAALLVVGSLDQTNPAEAPDHAALHQELTGLHAYVGALQDATAPDCGSFQIPVTPYPESAGAYAMNGYDQLKPYLADSDLRFGFGAMHGTADADWQQAVETEDLDTLARGLVSAGFCSIEVATRGFADPDAVTARLQQAYGPPLASSASGEFVSFDLRAVGSAGENVAALRQRTLQPVVVTLNAYEVEVVDGTAGQYVGPNAGVSVANLGEEPVTVDVALTVNGIDDEQRAVTVEDGQGTVVASGQASAESAASLRFSVEAPRGITRLTLGVGGEGVKEDGPGNRTISGFVSDLTASTTSGARVVSLQAQAATGWVLTG